MNPAADPTIRHPGWRAPMAMLLLLLCTATPRVRPTSTAADPAAKAAHAGARAATRSPRDEMRRTPQRKPKEP